MKVQLLGTGSSDGWPKPFCGCASCRAAASSPRAQTSVLIDDSLLVDPVPDTLRSAAQYGVSLAGLRGVLLTHRHEDHTAPATLRHRSSTCADTLLADVPIVVAGEASAASVAAQWCRGASFVAMSPGSVLDIGQLSVRALAASEGSASLAFEVTAQGGRRLLYATHTGGLPEATLDALRGQPLDALLLEETFGREFDHDTKHLDLRSFPRQLAALRRAGAVDEHTRVVAIHVSHHNPPPDELRRALSAWGADLLDDGAVIAGPRDGEPAPRRTLVLGGVRSGKSSWAELQLAADTAVTYVATAGASVDFDWTARLAAHRARRPAEWRTVETTDLPAVLRDSGDSLLIDDLGNWLARTLDDTGGWDVEPTEARKRCAELVQAWRGFHGRAVLVSNDVGSGVHPTTHSGRLFRDELGRLNAALAQESDEVVVLSAGIPQWLRGGNR